MGLPYDPHEIEARWQRRWDEDGTYVVDVAAADPATTFTNLVEFPYPSADGLHVGHVFRYGGADAFGRSQVDGRVRARVTVSAGLCEDEVRAAAESSPDVARHLAGRRVHRVVHVAGRLVNLVTQPTT